jgi:hypothetical protein
MLQPATAPKTQLLLVGQPSIGTPIKPEATSDKKLQQHHRKRARVNPPQPMIIPELKRLDPAVAVS